MSARQLGRRLGLALALAALAGGALLTANTALLKPATYEWGAGAVVDAPAASVTSVAGVSAKV